MSSITENLQQIKATLPEHVCLVAVSKLHPIEELKEAYQAGQRVFGESKVQELLPKHAAMPNNVQWHFIGHLQTNKVKDIVSIVDLIHGIDSLKLLKEVDKQASKQNKKVRCLLQIHIAQEESKFGFSADEVRSLLSDGLLGDISNASICGLMGMATFTENKELVRKEFGELKQLFDELKSSYFADRSEFTILSMGMSNDYLLAVDEGSTMVRVGSSIFGERVY